MHNDVIPAPASPAIEGQKRSSFEKVWYRFFKAVHDHIEELQVDKPDYEEGTYTPVVTSGTGAFVDVSATGQYVIIGNLVWFSIAITITDNGTAATNVKATLPSGTTDGTAVYKAISNTGGSYYGATLPTEGIVTIRTDGNLYPGGAGVTLVVTGSYLRA